MPDVNQREGVGVDEWTRQSWLKEVYARLGLLARGSVNGSVWDRRKRVGEADFLWRWPLPLGDYTSCLSAPRMVLLAR